MTTYRAALCGLGNIAWRFDQHRNDGDLRLSHAGAYQRHPETRLIAGYSPDPKDGNEFRQSLGLPVYPSLPTMLAEEKPDLVSICSPSQFHYEQVMTCLEQEVPMIWLEKPPALSLTEMDRLRVGLESGRSTLLVNYQRRYLPAYRELRQYFHENRLGACRQIQVTYSRGLETNGSHLLDMLFFITGDSLAHHLEWVSAAGDPDNPTFSLTMGERIAVIVIGIPLSYHNIDISLTCDQGRIAVLYGGMECLLETAAENELFPGFRRLYPQPEHHFVSMAGLSGSMENALQDLLDAHEQRRSPLSCLRTSQRTMQLMEEVRAW